MVLSPGQFYCVSLCQQSNSIQLDVILDKSTKRSAENRKELMAFFQSTLEQILKEMMPAAAKPISYICEMSTLPQSAHQIYKSF